MMPSGRSYAGVERGSRPRMPLRKLLPGSRPENRRKGMFWHEEDEIESVQ